MYILVDIKVQNEMYNFIAIIKFMTIHKDPREVFYFSRRATKPTLQAGFLKL